MDLFRANDFNAFDAVKSCWNILMHLCPYAIFPVRSMQTCLGSSFFALNWSCKSHIQLASVQIRAIHGNWKDGAGGVIWDAAEIANVVQGRLVSDGASGSICTDTRQIESGQWFLALEGDRFDGHDFLDDALNKGCAGVIARKVPRKWPTGLVQVEGKTLHALQKLASSVRKRYGGPVVGITGSVGKTTTRVMTALALGTLGHVHQTQGNLNNAIGVPLTLLKMPSFSSACVLEMGMNHSGEIFQLAEIAQPSVRVILNVGPAHIGNFASIEEVAAAKGEMLLNAKAGDICIINADDVYLSDLGIPDGVKLVRFGMKDLSDVRLLDVENIRGGCAVKMALRVKEENGCQKVECTIPSPGLHLASNACAATAIAYSLGIPLQVIMSSFLEYSPLGMRCRLEEVSQLGIRLINDAYNANPLSMEAALALLDSIDCKGRRIAVLGDMLELGTFTEEAHAKVLQLCVELQFEIIAVAGPAFAKAMQTLDKASMQCTLKSYEHSLMLANELVEELAPGDVVLIKGSRGSHMELISHAIRAKTANGLYNT